MAIRSTVHNTGADAVTELLRLSPPDDGHRSVLCTCGRVARYEGMRSRPILTVVGWARIDRPYYLCPACHTSLRACGACSRQLAAWRLSVKAETK